MTTATDHTTRSRDDQSEGAISTVIAVLIMVLLGAAMWLTFENIWSDTADNTENQVEIIDADTTSGVSG